MRKLIIMVLVVLFGMFAAFSRERLTLVEHTNDALLYTYEIGSYSGVIIASDGTKPKEDASMIDYLKSISFRKYENLLTTNMYAAAIVQKRGFAMYRIGDSDIWTLVLKEGDFYVEYQYCWAVEEQ